MTKKISLVLLAFFGYLWHFSLYLIVFPFFIFYIGRQLDTFLFTLVLNKQLTFYWGMPNILLGAVFFISGIILVLWAAILLSRNSRCFPFQSIRSPEFHPKKLTTLGLYGLVRHPMLLGYILMLIGGSILLGSLLSLLWTIPLFAWGAYEFAVYFEEKRLLAWFGEDYRNYQKTTPALFPIRFQSHVVKNSVKLSADRNEKNKSPEKSEPKSPSKVHLKSVKGRRNR